MRYITDHEINPVNQSLDVVAFDAPGQGNASHEYRISFKSSLGTVLQDLLFQNGPINEVGINGITNEALIAIVIDRLRSFQSGQYACRENALALTKLEESLHWLHHRTRARTARGVEGTNQV